MAKTDTVWDDNYPGIIIRNDASANPTFALTVKEQLDKIASKPVGRMMLRRIADRQVVGSSLTYKVCIMRAGNQVTLQNDPGRKWHAGNTTFGAKMDAAQNGGVGTPSAITYNPNIYVTPDGTRPPFIGLAHELIHAYHNLHGSSLGRDKDEPMVVGLGQYSGEEITENKIRSEHQVPERQVYTL